MIIAYLVFALLIIMPVVMFIRDEIMHSRRQKELDRQIRLNNAWLDQVDQISITTRSIGEWLKEHERLHTTFQAQNQDNRQMFNIVKGKDK